MEEEEDCFEEKILCKSPENYAADFSVDRTEQNRTAGRKLNL